jgi:two-component sensor histidine kinase
VTDVARPAIDVTPPLAATARKRRWSGGAIVIGLASMLVFAIFAIFAFLCWQAFGTTVAQTKTKAQVAADVVADQLQWSMSASLTALRFIADLGDAAFDPANRPRIETALDRLPSDAHLALYDATGVVRGEADGLAGSIADAAYFDALKQGQNWVIVPVGTDTSYLLIAQRLGGTSFVGVALLALPASLLESFWAPQNLGKDSTIAVNLEDGSMVGRYPPLAGPQSTTTSPMWATVKANQTGSYTIKSPVDGIVRSVGYRHIPTLGLITFATISQEAAFAAIWTAIATVLWLLVPIALMLLVFALVIARILNQSERTNAKLAAALAHNDVLFREIHHRVKNNLQSVASLLQMQPIDKAIKRNMGQRIAAMSAVHEHIYRSSSFTTVQVKPYLETLIQNIRAGGDPKVRLVEQLDDLSVDKDAATPLGLILNEVLSNAFKHAFPESREGTITVRLAATGDGRGRLVVEDDGVGFDPAVPAKGIGQRLIRALTEQLAGTSEMSAGSNAGSRFELVFPLAKAS